MTIFEHQDNFKETDQCFYYNQEAIFELDSFGKIIHANYQAFEITGYSKTELASMTLTQLFQNATTLEIDTFVDAKLAKGFSTTKKYLNKNGTIHYLQLNTVKVNDSKYFCYCKDVTQIMNSILTLESMVNRYRLVISSIKEGLVVHDSDGKIIICNKSAERILGLSEEQMAGTTSIDPLWRCVYEDGTNFPGECHPSSVTLRTGNPVSNIKMGVYKSDFSLTWISINSIPLYINDESVLSGVAVTFIDITDQKGYELELIGEKEETEKALEMKDEFLSIISHEFKTPITVINSAIQVMEVICNNELSVKAKEFLRKIKQNSNRQLRLVNNLIDITRLKSGYLKNNKKNMDIVLITRLITESITIYAAQKGIQLTFYSTLKAKLIGIDEEKYERILLNLLSNAVKFTPKGKSITVKVYQKIVNRKCKVCLQIRDKGIGIPANKQELIFEKFGQVDKSFNRQAEGAGIGLYLVKLLVELIDGEIKLESKEGKGSTFTITLPIIKEAHPPTLHSPKELNNDRVIQATNIEFSDIYIP
jgi:PAS domain S-box-containing protein